MEEVLAADVQLAPDVQTDLRSCWRTIGVDGDRSCPTLTELIHCRNCSIYAQGGRSLFDRPLPEDYRRDWTQSLAQGLDLQGKTTVETKVETLSLSLFRLEGEWFALPSEVFQSVWDRVVVRRIPQRSNALFLGLVNLGGELQLCFSLKNLLGVQTPIQTPQTTAYPRMVVIQAQAQADGWVFSVDELYGIERIKAGAIQTPPSHAKHHLTQGIFTWQGRSVSVLNAEVLFSMIERRLLP
jgi:chemotaxis-related protein WspD